MEAAREIYWNVGHGVILPMYFFAAGAAAVCLYGFVRRIRVYGLGGPLDRSSNPFLRLRLAAAWAFAQVKVLRAAFPGIFHAAFFWSFLLLFAGTLLIMAQEDFTLPLFGFSFLKGAFYKGYSLALDLAGLGAIAALLVFFARRFIARPEGLETSWDDYLAHGLLLLILITGFWIEGARMAATEMKGDVALARFSPVGMAAAGFLASWQDGALLSSHKVLWWSHLLLALGLIALIPFTRLRHLFLVPANYFFASLEPKGALKTLNLSDENAQSFGAGKVKDLTWKDIFDSDACVSCKRCQDECPAYATGKPLSPMQVVHKLKDCAFSGPETDIVAAVTDAALWACTTCGACQETCPAGVEHVGKIIEMRRNMTLMKGEFAGAEGRSAASSLEVNKNPFGLPYAERADWAAGLDVRILAEQAEADIIYFAGCYASFDRRNRIVAQKFIEICNHSGIRVGILGKEEKCCGEPVRKLGNEYLYQELAAENIRALNGYKVSRIVTACPHCRHTLGLHYRDLGLNAEVVHHSVFVNDLLKSGRLKTRAERFDFTYHDSCYLSRYSGTVEEPREVLKAAGGVLSEMRKNKTESFCCGGGGGRVLLEEKEGRKICAERIKMAQATGMPLVVSNCPFCLTMLEDGIKTSNCEEKLQARDLAEIVAERLA